MPGAICAAKKIHDIFLDSSEIPAAEIRRATAQFVRECQLMSTLDHPNIVKFLGVAFFPGSRLPALVMERLLTSLHDPPRPPPPQHSQAAEPKVLDPAQRGVRSSLPPRAITARHPPRLVGQKRSPELGDGGQDRGSGRGSYRCWYENFGHHDKGTWGLSLHASRSQCSCKIECPKSKYDASIDVFSLGVVTIFVISEVFPCDPLEHNYLNDETGLLVARTELQRRSEYMRHVNEQLRACGQLRGDHPLIWLIQQCLHNGPHKRPSIREVLRLLEEARAGARDSGWEEVQAAQTID